MGRTASVKFKDPYSDRDTPLTSGQVARECKVAPRTVSKWIDSGRLKGYRIPGSNDRRVSKPDLYRFLVRNGMPVSEGLRRCAAPAEPVTLYFGVGAEVTVADADSTVVRFQDPFEVGTFAATTDTRVVRAVLGDDSGLVTMAQGVRLIRTRFPDALVVLVVGDDVSVDLLESLGLSNETVEWRHAPVLLSITA